MKIVVNGQPSAREQKPQREKKEKATRSRSPRGRLKKRDIQADAGSLAETTVEKEIQNQGEGIEATGFVPPTAEGVADVQGDSGNAGDSANNDTPADVENQEPSEAEKASVAAFEKAMEEADRVEDAAEQDEEKQSHPAIAGRKIKRPSKRAVGRASQQKDKQEDTALDETDIDELLATRPANTLVSCVIAVIETAVAGAAFLLIGNQLGGILLHNLLTKASGG